MIVGAFDLRHACPKHFSDLAKAQSTHNPLVDHKVSKSVEHNVTRVPIWYASQFQHSLEVLQQAALGDWFDPIYTKNKYPVTVTNGCLTTLEIPSIKAEEDPAGAYLTGQPAP